MSDIYPLSYTANGVDALEAFMAAFSAEDFNVDGDLEGERVNGDFYIAVMEGRIEVRFPSGNRYIYDRIPVEEETEEDAFDWEFEYDDEDDGDDVDGTLGLDTGDVYVTDNESVTINLYIGCASDG